MLLEITIKNLALIREVSLSLGPGLNVLTGETGAGKSIVVDAMNLLVGGRALGEQVRTGTERACIEGLFDYSESPRVSRKLVELGLPVSEDSTLMLAREVVRGGRSVCRVNGRIVPLAMYRAIGELLVDLHGQHEHQSLLKVDQHLDLLDHFGGSELLERRASVENLYQRLVQIKGEQEKLMLDEKERIRRTDYLRHAIADIERLKPSPGEEIELEKERERLRYREKLTGLVKEITEDLFDGYADMIPAYDLLSRAADKAQEMIRYDETAGVISGALQEIKYRLEDVLGFLRKYREKLDFDPDYAQEVEERLHALKNLMRKYGASLEEVCAYRDQAAVELEELGQMYGRGEKLTGEYTEVLHQYETVGEELATLRREKAAVFTSAVVNELRSLGMENARFDIDWETLTVPTPIGNDRIEFLFSANQGEPLKPLAKIVSGGEMSRVMLALKVILAETDQIPTLIFDEIDTGIGGRTLQVVGERLSTVARTKQVLCVTHSPHIAGRGQRHFYIEKKTVGDQTCTFVHLLDEKERVKELARMLGGTENEEVTRSHAEEILRQK